MNKIGDSLSASLVTTYGTCRIVLKVQKKSLFRPSTFFTARVIVLNVGCLTQKLGFQPRKHVELHFFFK